MNLEPLLHLLADEPETPVDVTEINLLLSTDEYPNLDVHPLVERLDTYAATLRPRLRGVHSLETKVLELCQFLFGELGFTGNQEDYYDPRNSYMNEVMHRKLGIPITLSALAISVGQRAGMNILGVALPGHFIARAQYEDEIIFFDPFNDGRILDITECEQLIERITGKPFTVTQDTFQTALPGEIVVRMLNNLKGIYLEKGDFLRCGRVIERLKILLPADPHQKRDLGLCQVQLLRYGAAIDNLKQYLELVPGASDAQAISKILNQATSMVAKWN
ncbi:tetratricopeptide repeat protein [Telmatocola sphagniphila]|uniref:Tetratricopeptide repeat protein n=1 Tax=Telmatocola sphagniphila TaxID=1123043 RepID=A0A8E6B3K7_9BACT|nr:tetratricopeptide repeat protein [Telmatocola sphagniphila]QVL30684.1 tetratricopeptide repeat protein [Telmatocola sphagniphila]